MVDEADGQDAGSEASGACVDPAAVALALGGASRTEADGFLKKQAALIDDQRHHLREQFKQLRLNIWQQRMGVLLRAATAVGLGISGALGVMVWGAAHAQGLVIERPVIAILQFKPGNARSIRRNSGMKLKSCFKGGVAAAFIVCGAAGAALAQGPIPINDPPAPASVPGHLAKAAQIAGKNSFASLLAYEGLWCMGPTENREAVFALADANYAMPPEKWFDNLYFIGKPFVGAYILKTSAGLVMWDTLDNPKEAETMLLPGMKQLGLDPKDIKLIILTHGHFDHFGGAKYMQDTYHTPVAESQVDWDLMAAYKADGSDAHPYPPTKDRVLADGEDVKVGDATIHIVLTPGHSPGTVSSIVPVKDNGKTIMMAMWGGTAYPGTKAALDQMGDSMDKFKAAVAKYNAVGFLNTHPRAFYLRERLAAHDPKAPNPLVIGNADMQASVGVMRECLDNMKDWYGAMGKN